MHIHDDTVYILRRQINTSEAPFKAYRELASAALGFLDLNLPELGQVVLKPNATVLFPPQKRVITHPGFVGGMLDALVDKGVAADRLLVADGQSGENKNNDHTWERSGYVGMVAERGVALRMLNGVPTRPVEVVAGVVYDSYHIACEVTDCAFFFNVPLAKCHNLGCTTLSIKNLMGILVSPERHLCSVQDVDKPFEDGIWRLTASGLSLFEDRFCHKLCDLLVALRGLGIPRLSVVDGLVGRDGTAFNEGQNYPLGWTVIGENEVHVDTVATYLMGLDPECTPYLQCAAERGLGVNRMSALDVMDLATGRVLDVEVLEALRSRPALVPVARFEGGYYRRFSADGSAAPWRIDDVNRQRVADGLEEVVVDTTDLPT